MQVRLCSKSFKQGFSTTWSENFQKYKLDFAKAEEPEIKLPLLDHRKSKGIPEKKKKIYLCFIDFVKTFDCVNHSKLCKILKDVGVPEHLICLMSNLYMGQEATELNMEQLTGSKLEKEYDKAVHCHPTYLIYKKSTSREILGWMNHKLELNLPAEISTTSDMPMTPFYW